MKTKLVKINHRWGQTFKNALEGTFWAFGTQKNFKVHFVLAFLAIILGLYLEISFERLLILILAIVWGLTIEMANTAFEKTVDLITEENTFKAKIVKDVSAGMMLVLSLGLALLGILILFPPLWQRFLNLN